MLVKVPPMLERIDNRAGYLAVPEDEAVLEALRRHILTDVHLNFGEHCLLRGLEKLARDLLAHILFSAVVTDAGRNTLDHQRRTVPFKGHGGFALTGFPYFADDTLHVRLLLRPGSHRVESGSYTVITMIS